MKIENWLDICERIEELLKKLVTDSSQTNKKGRFTVKEVNQIKELIIKQKNFNGWFSEKNVKQALEELSLMLNKDELINWLSKYSFTQKPKNILIVMAGNIPLVGFHDLLCVWLSGNFATLKLSSDDNTLLPKILETISSVHPEINSFFSISVGPIKNIDAVIATGSDNANLYFQKYFGHLPSLFRKNRTSIAILDGDESESDLFLLGHDIFDYFGKGCRNVTYLFIPEQFDLNHFFRAIVPFGDIINHQKYGNNYDYQRTIHLMNQIHFLDNNFVLLKESTELFSPLAMVHYQKYSNQTDIHNFLNKHYNDIQIIIGSDYENFGSSQKPKLDDFADKMNTMKWLNNLS